MSRWRALFSLGMFIVPFGSIAEASHFRYGHITWARDSPDSRTVDLTVTAAWDCSALDPPEMRLDLGDGTFSEMPVFGQNTFIIGQGTDCAGGCYKTLRFTTRHTYASDGPFTAVMLNCCRISTLVNSPNTSFRLASTVDLRNANQGTPQSSLPAIVTLPVSSSNSVAIPAADPDGDPLSCQMASTAQSSITNVASGPNGTLGVSSACNLAWDTTGIPVGSLYAAQVLVQENHQGNIGYVPLDFIIQICSGDPPQCSATNLASTQFLTAGEVLTASISGTDPNGQNLTLLQQNLPGFCTLSPPAGTTNPQPFSVTLTCAPVAADVGTFQCGNVTFTDPSGLQGICSPCFQVTAQCAKPPSGIVSWWPLDETTGLLVTDIVHGNTGNWSSNPTPATGKVKGTQVFNGDWISVPDPMDQSLDFGAGEFSIDAWIYTVFLPVSYLEPIVDKREMLHTGFRGYSLLSDDFTGTLRFEMSDGSESFVVSGNILLTRNTWHHVAVSVTRNSVNGHPEVGLYLDGVLDAGLSSAFLLGSVSNSGELRIGGSVSPQVQKFQGYIDEVEIFNRAVSSADFRTIYSVGSTGKCKEFCHVNWGATCNVFSPASADVSICDLSGGSNSYAWSLSPLPAGSMPECDVAGPASFTPPSGSMPPPSLSPCAMNNVTIGCVSGGLGRRGCYRMVVQNTVTGKSFACSGSVLKSRWKIRGELTGIYPAPVGITRPIRFLVTNEEDSGGILNFRFEVMPPGSDPDNHVVSLNGMLPGTPIPSSISLGVGQTSVIEVNVRFGEHQPFEIHELVVSFDTDGDGEMEPAASIPLRSTLRVDFVGPGGSGGGECRGRKCTK